MKMMKKRIITLVLVMSLFLSFMNIGVVTSAEEKSSKPDSVTLDVTVRDFKMDGKLFEGEVSSVQGLVRTKIGSNKKPDFSDPNNPSKPLSGWATWDAGTPVTISNLNALFNDVPGMNKSATKKLTMTKDENGFYSIKKTDDDMFFPIDNELFGNEGNEHNYHFTMEMHTRFNYQGFEEFTFEGDDDVWVFINGQLVIDLGGVHDSQHASISLPELVSAGKLNIKPGQSFNFDMFYMERHKTDSNLSIVTNIDMTNTAYGEASSWATAELDRAGDYGFITDKIKDNMKAPITREEFAEVAVKLYEKYTGKKATYTDMSAFVDTQNPEIFKAFELKVVKGTNLEKKLFSPKDLTNREQVATMLHRAVEAIKPDADFSTSGAESFKDEKIISSWALESVKFMGKNGLIKGSGGYFDPKGTTTREMAVLIAVRVYEKYAGISN